MALLSAIIVKADSKNPLPRFVSIKSNEVNVRAGPNLNASIEWIFIKKGEPVEVIAEYEQWRQVRDIKSEGGWVHASVLSSKRFVVIIGDNIVPLMSSHNGNSKIVVNIAPQVRCQLFKVIDDWCKIQCGEYNGWLQKKLLWGVYAEEK